MKRFWAVVCVFTIMLSVCGCSKTKVDTDADVSLSFVINQQSVNVNLTADEAKEVIAIFNGKSYDSIFSGIPSCGFDENVSLKVGNRVFAIACDTCSIVQDLGNLRYFSVSTEEIQYIHKLFEKYGGYFPCI